jgi:hypothetical protein
MIKWLLGIIVLASITGCGCTGIECAPCSGEPRIEWINNAIIEFDTSANNFKITNLNTLLLYKDLSAVNSKVPTDTFINENMDTQIKGYLSSFTRLLIKIDYLFVQTYYFISEITRVLFEYFRVYFIPF